MMHGAVAELESGERIEIVRPNGKGWRTVLAHGCFDLLHLGHIRHLQEARALGDELVVSVTSDAHVRKGEGRPVFSAAQRAEALKSLSCVDAVIINDAPDAAVSIEKIKPTIYVKGVDYAHKDDAALEREIAAVTAIGGAFHVTKSQKWSSTRLIAGERLSEEAIAYLDSARDRGFIDDIVDAFAEADNLKIAFVGETIIDEYRYVSPLGRPAKEFILATVEAKEAECFAGGVIAASKHADWPNIEVETPVYAGIKKTRFVDPAFNRKLFEVYNFREMELTAAQRAQYQIKLDEAVKSSDVVVCFDFGHGLLGSEERGILEGARFLALNVQTNTGNYGFNPVTKYARADYVCIDEPESRLAAVMPSEPVPWIVRKLNERMQIDDIVITHGRNGCYASHRDEGPITIPAFATHGLDTMGAGDAFLAVTAPLVAVGLGLETAAFVGNVAGALKTEIVGHRTHVSREALMARIEGLLA